MSDPDPNQTEVIGRMPIVQEPAAEAPTQTDVVTPPPIPHPPRRPPSMHERYELLGEIARGGMGVLYKARDTLIGREVVVKVLREDFRGRPAAERRFMREAQVTGQLQHPGVVPVYDVGRLPDGRPYLTMRFVYGRTLESLLADRPDRPRLARVVEQVCQTVAYAHTKGVVHRDLKPLNVMVSGFGQVRLLDWGLAKLLPNTRYLVRGTEHRVPSTGYSVHDVPLADGPPLTLPRSAHETAFGAAVGTPAFMPPEQAAGDQPRIDTRADVFGLGGLLLCVLTGHPPYTGSAADVWHKCRAGDLAGAHTRLTDCGGPLALVALTRRCLAPDPADRPHDARQVAAELAAALAPSPWSGVWAAVRRAVGV